MPRLTRKNIKVFAGSATNNGVFGSLQANNPTTTSDVEQLQSLSAWSEGWNAATETSDELPPLEEIQGVEYVTTYQQAYIMQEGVPEWAATVTYYKGCLTKEVTSTGFKIYNSLTDNNTGNLLSDTSNWKKVMDSDDVYAFDNTVVHKTGNETIAGTKTFTNGMITDNILPKGDITLGTSTNTWGKQLQFRDTAGKRIARIQPMAIDTTNNRIGMWVNNADNTVEKGISIDSNGTTQAPTPSAGDNSNQIATTRWVNSTGNNVVHKTGDETIGGVKTFNNAVNLANGTWNNAGDDVQIGDVNQAGCLCLRGVNDQTGLAFFPQNSNSAVNYIKCDGLYLHCITPNFYGSNGYIVTTEWINNKFQLVSALPVNPDGNIWYGIPE